MLSRIWMTTSGSITVKDTTRLWGTKPQNTCSLTHDQRRRSNQQIFYLKITDFLSRQRGTVQGSRVLQKNATEFQAFFEEIMGKAFRDFQKIRPYGKQGDRGNDGYRPTEGIYYQAYAPKDPKEKEAEAAKKFKNDFGKLKTNWDQISNHHVEV